MTLKPHIPDALRSLRARVFFAVLVVGMIPVVVAVGWLWLYDASNDPAPPYDGADRVYEGWASGTSSDEYGMRRTREEVDASLADVRGTLQPSEYKDLRSHVDVLIDMAAQGYDYSSLDVPGMAGLILDEYQIRALRAQGYYWGPCMYTWQEPTLGGDPNDPATWAELSTETPIVAWMTGKNSADYVRLVPAEAGWSDRQSLTWWYALLVVVGLAMVAGLAVLATLLATRGVRRPLRLVTEEAERAAAAAPAEVVPLSGPPEVKRLTAAVNRLAAQSSRAQRAEQSFLLSVSHELKTPLTSLRGYGEGLKDGALDAATAGEVIVAESGRLERFVQDLLDSARFGRGEFVVKKEKVDLEALARDVVGRHRASAEGLGVGLAVEGDAGAAALADPDRVVQVVSNLVENAVRCTPSGGAVTVTVAPGEVAVSDTGSGLGTDDLEHAFDRFYLHNRYGRGRDVGTGLGLAIVKDLVERMEGSVAVASELGVGSTFTVRLPVVD